MMGDALTTILYKLRLRKGTKRPFFTLCLCTCIVTLPTLVSHETEAYVTKLEWKSTIDIDINIVKILKKYER